MIKTYLLIAKFIMSLLIGVAVADSQLAQPIIVVIFIVIALQNWKRISSFINTPLSSYKKSFTGWLNKQKRKELK